MIDLKGTKLDSFPISKLRHKQDLVYFDGPLISHFEHANGDDYLRIWCDCTKELNRWMIIRVNEASILRLLNRIIPLDFVVPKLCRDDFVYFIDEADNFEIESVRLVLINNVPYDYTPSPGAFVDTDDANVKRPDDGTYAILVEGNWAIHDLGKFPRTFGKAYSFLYSVSKLNLPELADFPWKGGFSSMHFHNWTFNKVPVEDRPTISEIQYASPGFIRFRLDASVANLVMQSIEDLRKNNKLIGKAYADIGKYIFENDLNETDNVDSSHDEFLTTQAKVLMSGFSAIKADSFLEKCRRPFEAAKIARSFFNCIRDLNRFETNGQVHYPFSNSRD